MSGVPENHRVEEPLGVLVCKLQRPVLAGVGGVVDAALVAGAGGHQEGVGGGEGDHGAEVESSGVRNLGSQPVATAVGSTEIGAVSTAGPADLLGDGADASEIFGVVCFLYLRGRLGLSEDASGPEQEQSQRSRHRGIVAEKLPVALAAGGREH